MNRKTRIVIAACLVLAACRSTKGGSEETPPTPEPGAAGAEAPGAAGQGELAQDAEKLSLADQRIAYLVR